MKAKSDIPALGLLAKKAGYRLKVFYYLTRFRRNCPEGKLPVGLAGCGNFVKCAYLPALNSRNCPVYVSGLYSRLKEKTALIRRMLRYENSHFDSYPDLLNSGIKGVLIALPNHLHFQRIIDALENNIDVFCEKPLVNDLKDAYALRNFVNKTKMVLMAGFNQRYTDRIIKVKELIDSGALGRLRRVTAFHNQDIGDYILKSRWLSDSSKSGGGVLHNAGIHLVNIMLYFFGPLEYVRAELTNKKLPVNSGEDTACCRLYFKSGVQGELFASYINGVKSSYEHMIIEGSSGACFTDMSSSSIKYKKYPSGSWQDLHCKRQLVADSIYNELAHFCDCVRNRKQPLTGIGDSIDTLIALEACRVSSAQKRRVSTDEISCWPR
ncbi:MAG: Gfo/Idh/MocA family oxidoreductase [Candidatus Omnitrophota bacterium]